MIKNKTLDKHIKNKLKTFQVSKHIFILHNIREQYLKIISCLFST